MSEIAIERGAVAVSKEAKSALSPKKIALAGLALAAALAASSYGYSWWTAGRFLESTDDAYVGGNITPISPQVAGFVSEILVKDHQAVTAGQLLIRIDGRTLQAVLSRAEAVVRQQEATLENLRARLTLQRSAIRQAEADLTGKIAQAAYANEDAERYRALASSDSGSRQNSQKSLAANISAQSAVASARANLEGANQQLAVLSAEIAQTAASVDAAKADVETARLNLGYTEIRSPIDGYIGNRAAQVGAYVSTGNYLLTIVPAHGLWVDANFKEDQLHRMKRGQSVSVVADIFPGEVIKGRIGSVAPATGAVFSIIPPENATGNFTKIVQRVPVRIELESRFEGFRALRPGLSTTVTVDTRSSEDGAN